MKGAVSSHNVRWGRFSTQQKRLWLRYWVVNHVDVAKVKPKRAESAPPKQRNGNTLQWSLFSVALSVATVVFDPGLVDASNVVRFTVMALLLTAASWLAYRRKMMLCVGLGGAAFFALVLLALASQMWSANAPEALYEASRWAVAGTLMLQAHALFRKQPARATLWLSRVSLAVFLLSMAVAFCQIAQAGDMRWSSRYCVTSLYTHKGTFCLMLLLMSAFPVMRLRLPIRRGRWVYAVMLAGVLSMLLFLQSRSALVALIVTLPAAGVLWLLRKVRVGIVGKVALTCLLALALGAALIGGCRMFAEMQTDGPNDAGGLRSNASIFERQSLWRVTLRLADRNPAFGCGAGNWKVCHPEASVADVFSIDVLDFTFVRPHNEYLRILSELGYVGFALFLLSVSGFFVSSALGAKGRWGRVARAGGAVLAGVAVFAVFDFPLDRMESLCWLSLVAGCVSACGCTRCGRALPSWVWVCISLSMALTALLGASRWRSEHHQMALRGEIHAGRWGRVEAHCKAARTRWCTLTSTGIPYAYYEGMAQEYMRRPALESFRQAHADAPYNKQVLCDLGRLEYTDGHDTAAAVRLLREAIRVSPAFSYAYYNLAQIYLMEGSPDEAAKVLRSLDLTDKQSRIDRLIWQYHQGEDVHYYQDQLVPAERAMCEQMLELCQ